VTGPPPTAPTLLSRLTASRTRNRLASSVLPPPYPGMRLTAKRLLNFHLVRYQRARGHTKLLGYPLVVTLEATNVCNLKCPYCFTGAGEVARKRSMMPMPLFQRLMDELGAYMLHLEFYNWGEPLLNKNTPEMIRIASAKGVSTIISTHLSVPMDRSRAETLVSSGLALLGAALDGATQKTYEKYRAGGNLELVLHNLRLLVEAKQRLGSTTPRLCWGYHVFDHNWQEVELARKMASELGVEFSATKGWVAGPEWNDGGQFQFPVGTAPERCRYLWTQGVINNDGGVAPCSATFYREDDFGSVEQTTFKEVWNNDKFRDARRMYRGRLLSQYGKSHVCHDCPYTIIWENYQHHLAQGFPSAKFNPGFTTNDWFNYFFSRRPGHNGAPKAT